MSIDRRRLLLAGVPVAGIWLLLRARRMDLRDAVVLITGGTRGLGLALAREFASHGARIAICARDERELETARAEFAERGTDLLAVRCDVGDRRDVHELVEHVLARFGRLDVLVNNAGIITVGPVDSGTDEDLQAAMDVMFWGVVHPTLSVLPHMRDRGRGRIVNVTSIGGKLSAPHLLAYNTAKFAAVGFSEGLRAEVVKDGVAVTTVVPGFMRTGAHVNALFKGNHRREYAWFSIAGNLPFTSISAARAARQIVDATRRGAAEVIITPQAKLAARFAGLFPGLTARLLSGFARTLPRRTDRVAHPGWESESPLTRSPLLGLGRRAAHEYQQFVAPEPRP